MLKAEKKDLMIRMHTSWQACPTSPSLELAIEVACDCDRGVVSVNLATLYSTKSVLTLRIVLQSLLYGVHAL